MERCPNCGAPARPGAKFCTTCGYRLPMAPPAEPAADDGGTAANGVADSWPAPPLTAGPDSMAPTSEPAAEAEASDEVIAMPAPAASTDGDTDPTSDTGSDDDSTSTDSVLSSSWPSPASAPQSDPWAMSETSDQTDGVEDDEDDELVSGVTEEVIVVPAPASQYESWSSAVVEEIAPATASAGTNIARALALLDELRLLLPALGAGSSGGRSETHAAALEAIITASTEAAEDRWALRSALTEARDNPRDIQTILALSQQTDAALALLDEHDRLISAVQAALPSLKPDQPGISS